MIALPRVHTDSQTVPVLPEGFDIYNGRLFHNHVDLSALVDRPLNVRGRIEMPATPAYIRELPALRHNYHNLLQWFEEAKRITGYSGTLEIAYASKANPAEPVVRTLLNEGAAYECSSSFDIDIIRYAAMMGWVDHSRTILSNGFKIPIYAEKLIQLRAEGFEKIVPIFDDLDEIEPFAASGLSFDVGLRSRTDANYINRFGLNLEELLEGARRIASHDNLRLTMFHAMQTVSASRGLPYQVALAHSIRMYAALKHMIPTLTRYDMGGSLPGRNSGIDFQDWMIQTLRTILSICDEEEIPVPDLMIESGRYLVQDHACKMFRVLKSKMADDGIPFYVIDGSIMSNFPDAWALGDAFTVLPINNWNGEFQPVRLSGLTCDPDDIYPTHRMADEPIMMPVNTEGLIIGFFDCGAYQETLSGRQGAKHCLLPEGSEIILDNDGYSTDLELIACSQPQNPMEVLGNLGYSLG